MDLKKVIWVSVLGLTVSLNASFISAVAGPDTSDEGAKPRGIIANQDIDGDGILDSKDDCLETNPCGKEGCQPPVIPDTDGDGVLDDKDECPKTPKGFIVDEVGCSKKVDLSVLFDVDEYVIKSDFKEKIDDLIIFLEKLPHYSVIIEGHTDSDGTNVHNMELSQNRANAVKEYMLNNSKIDESRIDTQWFGEEKPLNENANDEEKQENRRVIAILNKNK